MDLLTAMAIGGSIGIAIVALTYMVSYLLNSNPMRAYAKQEMIELLTAAIIVVIVAQMVGAPNVFFSAVMPDEQPRIGFVNEETVQMRIHNYMEEPLLDLTEAMVISSMRLSKLTSYNYNYQMGNIPYINPTGSASPGAGGNMLQYALTMGIDSTSMMLLLATSIKIIFVFLAYTTTLALLPLGIILRFIPFTRQIGALLMAIGLAVMFVFPLSVFWSTNLLWSPKFAEPIPDTSSNPGTHMVWRINDPPGADLICSPVAALVVMVGEDVISAIVKGLACLIPTLTPTPLCVDVSPVNPSNPPIPTGPGLQHYVAMAVYAAKLKTSGDASNALKSGSPTSDDVMKKAFTPLQLMLIEDAVPRNMAVLFMAVLQLLVSIVMVKNISQALGAENQLYGLSRLV